MTSWTAWAAGTSWTTEMMIASFTAGSVTTTASGFARETEAGIGFFHTLQHEIFGLIAHAFETFATIIIASANACGSANASGTTARLRTSWTTGSASWWGWWCTTVGGKTLVPFRFHGSEIRSITSSAWSSSTWSTTVTTCSFLKRLTETIVEIFNRLIALLLSQR
jgi:hypothetical protein